MALTLLQASAGAELLPTLLMFAVMFLVVYFLMIRPQNKRQKAEQDFQNSVKKGDRVVTTAGIHGRVVDLPKDAVVIDTGGGKIKFERAALSEELTTLRYSGKAE
ncbi:MAG: preprotein translocase subunit YajC [Flavobacteriaceae bacterium]|nr:MAG: preprotein translocase subunit YajC [Flavobacteriaceae bacterium]